MRFGRYILLTISVLAFTICQAQPQPGMEGMPEDSLFVSQEPVLDALETAAAPDSLNMADVDSLPALPSQDLHEMMQDLALRTMHEEIERLLVEGNYERALSLSDTTLYLAETPENYYYQGVVNECLSAWRQAEWAYSKAIRLNSSYEACYLPLVRVLLNLNRPEEAMMWSDRLFDLDSSQYEGLLYRSRAFAMLNEYQEAVADISQFIEIDTTRMDAYRLRAAYYTSLSKYQAAAADYTVLIRHDRKPEWYALRADCYKAQKLYEPALQDSREVVAMTVSVPDYFGLYQAASDDVRQLQQLLGVPEQPLVTQNIIHFPPNIPDSTELRVVLVPPAAEEK